MRRNHSRGVGQPTAGETPRLQLVWLVKDCNAKRSTPRDAFEFTNRMAKGMHRAGWMLKREIADGNGRREAEG